MQNKFTFLSSNVAMLALSISLFQGCDFAGPPSESLTDISFNLSAYTTKSINGRMEGCITTMDRGTLRVSQQDSIVFEQELGIPAGSENLTFEGIALKKGTFVVEAEVFSTQGVLLLSNRTEENEQNDRFVVEMTLNPLAPILQVCPEELTMRDSANTDFGEYSIKLGQVLVSNIGSGRLVWRLDAERDPAGNAEIDPCFPNLPIGDDCLSYMRDNQIVNDGILSASRTDTLNLFSYFNFMNSSTEVEIRFFEGNHSIPTRVLRSRP